MRKTKGQALLEYILLVVMLAITMAVTIRKSSRTIYYFWTGLARSVAAPCAGCTSPPPPDLRDRFDAAEDAPTRTGAGQDLGRPGG